MSTRIYLTYNTPETFLEGLRWLSNKGIVPQDAFMPFPVKEAEKYVPIKKDRWGLFALFYGLLGAFSALAMVYYMMAVSYPNNIGAKPNSSPVGWVPVVFEIALFFAFHLTVITFLIRKFRKKNTHSSVIDPNRFVVVLSEIKDESLLRELENTETEVKINVEPNQTSIWTVVGLLPLSLLAISCVSGNDTPAREYFPVQDMRYFVSYPPNGVNPSAQDSLSNRIPPLASLPEDYCPMPLPDTETGYEQSKTDLQPPFGSTEPILEQGRQLYSLYCALCHGQQGLGDGTLSENGKISGVPAFEDQTLPDITEGSIYYVLYYGHRMMGKYTSMTTERERWILAYYVMKLKQENSAALSD